MWDLVPWPAIEPGLPALGVQSLSHWTTSEVPWCPSKKRDIWTQIQRGGHHVKTETQGRRPWGKEAEIGVRHLQAREHQGYWQHQKLEESNKGPLLKASERAWAWGYLDFRCLASRTVREYISLVMSQPVCGHLFWQPQESNPQMKDPWFWRSC